METNNIEREGTTAIVRKYRQLVRTLKQMWVKQVILSGDFTSRGVILYVKESNQGYKKEADCDEAVWCKIVSGNSTLTIGLVYQNSYIDEADNTRIQNAINEVSKVGCINGRF